jgi:hypothetical protein
MYRKTYHTYIYKIKHCRQKYQREKHKENSIAYTYKELNKVLIRNKI